jgi:hypothetical protein
VQTREIVPDSASRVPAVETREVSVPVLRIRVVGGVAISSSEQVPARAWDFGEFVGRCRLSAPAEGASAPRLLRLRYGKRFDDLLREGTVREIALAPGETVVLDPEVVRARWVAVLDGAATPEVVPDDLAKKKRTPDD